VSNVANVSFISALADLILAPICLACAGAIRANDSARLICRRCRAMIRPIPAPACARCGATLLATARAGATTCLECASWPGYLTHARSACLLHPPADTIVHQLKYRGWRALASPMADRMADLALPPETAEAHICTPVPTTRVRLRQRGYNQAELIARAFAKRTGRRLRNLLRRSGSASSQTTLQPAARGANVAGAFHVPDTEIRSLQGAHLLLIDDVLTTGATAVECARTLAAAGARAITVVTFARALDSRRLTRT
jgi:ComF family protein